VRASAVVRKLAAATVSALVLAGACPPVAPAAQAPGRVVFEFPGAGGVRVGAPQSYGATAVTALRDGRVVVAGVRPGRQLVVAQLTPEGVPEEEFGVSGFVWPSLPTPAVPIQVFAQPNRRLVVASALAPRADQQPDLVILRLTSSGKGDPTFGRGGVTVLRGIRAGCASCPLAAVASDGAVVLAASSGSASAGQFTVVRVTPDGGLDPAFGQGGVAIVPGGGIARAVALQPDGTILATGVRGASRVGYTGVLARLTPAGILDPAFAGGAPVQTPMRAPHQLLLQPDGSVLVLGAEGNAGRVARYTAAGALDTSFGDQGVVALAEGVQGTAARLLPERDGQALVVGGSRGASVSNDPFVPAGGAVVVVRLGADGRPDPVLGGDAGVAVRVGFGGGDLDSRSAGRVYQNTFDPSRLGTVAQRADRSLVLAGEVHVVVRAGGASARFISRPAVAALTAGFTFDPTFGGSEILALGVRVPSQRVGDGVNVSLRSSQPALARVRIRARRHTIARATVPLFIAGAQQVKIPLTAYGRRALARHRRIRVRARAYARDLVGNTVQAVGDGTIRAAPSRRRALHR
jgi:uncharacterized delta-60 repeat protein